MMLGEQLKMSAYKSSNILHGTAISIFSVRKKHCNYHCLFLYYHIFPSHIAILDPLCTVITRPLCLLGTIITVPLPLLGGEDTIPHHERDAGTDPGEGEGFATRGMLELGGKGGKYINMLRSNT